MVKAALITIISWKCKKEPIKQMLIFPLKSDLWKHKVCFSWCNRTTHPNSVELMSKEEIAMEKTWSFCWQTNDGSCIYILNKTSVGTQPSIVFTAFTLSTVLRLGHSTNNWFFACRMCVFSVITKWSLGCFHCSSGHVGHTPLDLVAQPLASYNILFPAVCG